jgi:cell division protein FtsZ
VQSITDLILVPGIINIDIASVLSIMRNSGQTLFGVGRMSGENRAIKAAETAINSPLLDFSIKGAKGVLFSVSGVDVTLNEIQQAAQVITKNVDSKAQIIFGAVKPTKDSPDTKKTAHGYPIKVTVIATKL